MNLPPRRLLVSLLGGIGVVALALPAEAQAHGIVGKADLPIPVWLFSWAAAIVLVISSWRSRRCGRAPSCRSRTCAGCSELRPRASPAVPCWNGSPGWPGWVCWRSSSTAALRSAGHPGQLLGDVHLRHLLGGYAGRERPVRRCLPSAQPVAHVRSRHVGVRAPGAPRALRRPTSALPAVARGCGRRSRGSSGFAWLELIYVEKDRPATLAALSLGYFLVMLAGMALFGVDDGVDRRTDSASTSTCSPSSRRSCVARTARSISGDRSAEHASAEHGSAEQESISRDGTNRRLRQFQRALLMLPPRSANHWRAHPRPQLGQAFLRPQTR